MTITRFAPSPTGFLHIGGARTALFNWLYAKHTNGRFLLRIEDTDRARSTSEATQAILDSMQWLGLKWDGEEIYQFSRAERHREVVTQLLAQGHAYRCYCTQEELQTMRAEAEARKETFKYDRRWRDITDSQDRPHTIRIKAPLNGSITIEDKVQGSINVSAEELDDFVLLRADGTPTYMLAVVVDDYDMGVTHIIRGDDHLNNAFRQSVIYSALGWNIPNFAHIPLIHGQDGAKLSKRHGALGVDAYCKMGFLPEAIRNYLLRLGWSHGDDEIISTEQAIEWFDFSGLGKSSSRFDIAKLEYLNAHYIKEADDNRLVELTVPFIRSLAPSISHIKENILLRAMPGLKPRAKTLIELAEASLFYLTHPEPDEKAKETLNADNLILLRDFLSALEATTAWNHETLQQSAKAFAEAKGLKLGKLMAPIRASITGRTASPSMFEAMEILGKEESLARIRQYV